MSEAEKVLELAAEIRRYMKIEKAARKVLALWESEQGLLLAKEGYSGGIGLDFATLRDAFDGVTREKEEDE
jgi:hypothetical protein